MDTTQDLVIGQVVKSKAGRDKGKIFLITEIVDDKHILIADGDLRKLSSPKLKKIKHIAVYNSVVEDFVQMLSSNKKIDDASVRKLLAEFLTSSNRNGS